MISVDDFEISVFRFSFQKYLNAICIVPPLHSGTHGPEWGGHLHVDHEDGDYRLAIFDERPDCQPLPEGELYHQGWFQLVREG